MKPALLITTWIIFASATGIAAGNCAVWLLG